MFGSSTGKRPVACKVGARIWVNPSECSEAPFLLLPKGDFILIGGEVAHTFGLISVITSGMAKSYDGSVGAKVWDDGIACHAALMVRGEGAGMVPRPNPSTSDTNVAVDLDAELERTRLHFRC
ncbi:hypothetical protein BHM03_00043849 [Ensete ventricosum]|nr:hypothetical protein BHM03_00043849 [Ensete ventricosum]